MSEFHHLFSCPCGEEVYSTQLLDDNTSHYRHGENPEAVLIVDYNDHRASGFWRIADWLQRVHAYKATGL